VLVILRLISVINAAIWLGSAVSYICVIAPGFFSDTMRPLLPFSHAGAAELIVRERYFALQYWCGGIALGHLFVEWLYTGKSLRRWPTYLVVGLLGLGLLGGGALRPKLQRLHLERYGARSDPQQSEQAGRALRNWQIVARVINVMTVIGLGVYMWHVASTGAAPRFASAVKFRGLTNQVS